MNKNEYRKISRREAFASIGLHPKNDSTFFLANMIIEVKENTLRITKVSGKESTEPEDTYETNEPFVFSYNGFDYFFKVEDQKLNIYEKQQLIGG